MAKQRGNSSSNANRHQNLAEATMLLMSDLKPNEPTFSFEDSDPLVPPPSAVAAAGDDTGFDARAVDVAVFLVNAVHFDANTKMPRVCNALAWIAANLDKLERHPVRISSIALTLLQMKDAKAGGAAFVLEQLLSGLQRSTERLSVLAQSLPPIPGGLMGSQAVVVPPSAAAGGRSVEEVQIASSVSNSTALASRLLETELVTLQHMPVLEAMLGLIGEMLLMGRQRIDLPDAMTMLMALARFAQKCSELNFQPTGVNISALRQRVKSATLATLEPPVGAILSGTQLQMPKLHDLVNALQTLSRLNERDTAPLVEGVATVLPQQMAVATGKDIVAILQALAKLVNLLDRQVTTRIIAALRPRIIALLSNTASASAAGAGGHAMHGSPHSSNNRFRHVESSACIANLSKLKVDVATDIVKALVTNFCLTINEATPQHIGPMLQGLLRLHEANQQQQQQQQQSSSSAVSHHHVQQLRSNIEANAMMKVFERLKDCVPLFKGADDAATVIHVFAKLYPQLAFPVFALLQPTLAKDVGTAAASTDAFRLHMVNQVFAALSALALCPTTTPSEEATLAAAQQIKMQVLEQVAAAMQQEPQQQRAASDPPGSSGTPRHHGAMQAKEVVIFVSNVLKEALKNEDELLVSAVVPAPAAVAATDVEDEDLGGGEDSDPSMPSAASAAVATAASSRVTLSSTLPLLIARAAPQANAFEVGAMSRSLVRMLSHRLGTKESVRAAAAALMAQFVAVASSGASLNDTVGMVSLASRMPSAVDEAAATVMLQRSAHLLPAAGSKECVQLAFHTSSVASALEHAQHAALSDALLAAAAALGTAIAEKTSLMVSQLTVSEAALIVHSISVFHALSGSGDHLQRVESGSGEAPLEEEVDDSPGQPLTSSSNIDGDARGGGGGLDDAEGGEQEDPVEACMGLLAGRIGDALAADPHCMKAKELVMFLRAVGRCGVPVPQRVLYVALDAAKATAPTIGLQELSLLLVVFSHLGVWNARVMSSIVEAALDTVAGSTLRQCTSTMSALVRSGFFNKGQSFRARGDALMDRGVASMGSSRVANLGGNKSNEHLCTAVCERLSTLLRVQSYHLQQQSQQLLSPKKENVPPPLDGVSPSDVCDIVRNLAAFDYPPRPLFDLATQRLFSLVVSEAQPASPSSGTGNAGLFAQSSVLILKTYWRCASRPLGEHGALNVVQLFAARRDVPRSIPVARNTLTDVATELALLSMLLADGNSATADMDAVAGELWHAAARQALLMNAAGFGSTLHALQRLAPDHPAAAKFVNAALGNSKVFVSTAAERASSSMSGITPQQAPTPKVSSAVIKKQHWSLHHTSLVLASSAARPGLLPPEVVASCRAHFLASLPAKSAKYGDEVCNALPSFIVTPRSRGDDGPAEASGSSAASTASSASMLLHVLSRKEASISSHAALRLLHRLCQLDAGLLGTAAFPADAIRLLERRIVRDVGAVDPRGVLLVDVARLVTLGGGEALRALREFSQHQLPQRLQAFVAKCQAERHRPGGASAGLNSASLQQFESAMAELLGK